MRNEQIRPEVGMGCTECIGTDRDACTITRVSPSGKTIWFRQDIARVVSGSVHDGSAEYEYEFNENGYEQKATLRQDGRYRVVGRNFGSVVIGVRRQYYDPCF